MCNSQFKDGQLVTINTTDRFSRNGRILKPAEGEEIVMSNIPEREERLLRSRCSYDRTKLYAELHIARASTGVSKLRKIKKPTGKVGQYVECTDEEKVEDSLNTALVHIQNLERITEIIIALEKDDLKAYNKACQDYNEC